MSKKDRSQTPSATAQDVRGHVSAKTSVAPTPKEDFGHVSAKTSGPPPKSGGQGSSDQSSGEASSQADSSKS